MTTGGELQRSQRRPVPAVLALFGVLGVLTSLSLGSVVGCTARRAPEEASKPQAVLRWQARKETGIYGYLVFRAVQPEGPFLRISEQIIPVVSGGPEIGSYRFVDRDVEPGRTYYYALDVVQNSGRKRRFSGVMSKTVSR